MAGTLPSVFGWGSVLMRRIRIPSWVAIALLLGSRSVYGFSIVSLRDRSCETKIPAGYNDDDSHRPTELNRRDALLGATAATIAMTSFARKPANAVYVLDDETGDYVEVEDVDWQTAWKQRLDKASGMSQAEIFQAARGAGNVNLKEGEAESEASKKRRALSGCRDSKVRTAANAGSERDCTGRVLGGEYKFVLDAL